MTKKKINEVVTQGTLSQEELVNVSGLLSSIFPKNKTSSVDYLEWQYTRNPDGNAITFNAFWDEELIAHYAIIPISMKLFGKTSKGCLSLNSAVAEKAQGRGYFKKLATLCYEVAGSLGYDFIVGVTNANSTHGFHSLQFQLISSLSCLFFGGQWPLLPGAKDIQLERAWSEETLIWRLQRPHVTYKTMRTHEALNVYRRSNIPGLDIACLQLAEDQPVSFASVPMLTGHNHNMLRLKLWIGLSPSENNFKVSIPLPVFLRPSPLNLQFKDLSGQNMVIDPQQVQFNVLDFDAF